MTSAIDATKPIAGTPTTQSVRDNFATAKAEITALQTSVGSLIGAGKNALINPNFTINQDAVSGTVTLAAGVYGHDGWKAGSSGCTYTFTASMGINTLTITAGTLLQIIEGNNLPLGTNACVLSWTGTAQGRFGLGSYGASGTVAMVAGGSNLTVEFGTGTLSMVQLEKGSVPTVYEQRPYSLELELCRYYYEVLTSVANQSFAVGTVQTSYVAISLSYAQKRASPVITLSAGFAIYDGVSFVTGVTLFSQSSGLSSAYIVIATSAMTAGRGVLLMSDTTAGRTIKINARL
ncbi:MAG: hypothetical protein NTW85_06590 [Methylococcales bacterium]|nr:hypothetical protein [Methylococcales bacterium]